MRLEYFQMIDRFRSFDAAASSLTVSSSVPLASPIFEGHFPGFPIMPGVLLLETMAQTSGFLLLLLNRMAQMPFFAGVKKGKFRTFVAPGSELDAFARVVHVGSGYAVTTAGISVGGKDVCEAEITFGLVPFPAPELKAYLRGEMERVGLTEADLARIPGLTPAMTRRDVVVTGIGLVSSLGEGTDAHWAALAEAANPEPSIDRTLFPPFSIHRMVPLDLDRQIPKKGDQRQMEPWQRIGTYAAGLALADAGVAGNLPLLARMDMIVAAGGGERDPEVDATILRDAPDHASPAAFLNERLASDLRPTLFLAQLANLLAGNISIVHKVTGSSRTLMGEESAGVSAVEVASRRIAAGQGDIALVGGAYNAERYEVVADLAMGGKLWRGEPLPVWARAAAGGGLTLGSIGAFLVLEAGLHARARGARSYARVAGVLNDRSRRTPGAAGAVAERQFAALRPGGPPPAVLSGAGGLRIPTLEERAFLEALSQAGAVDGIRAPLSMLGTVLEPTFPALVALAALALHRKGFYRPIDGTGLERPRSAPPDAIIVTGWGHWRGEGMALIEAAGD